MKPWPRRWPHSQNVLHLIPETKFRNVNLIAETYLQRMSNAIEHHFATDHGPA